MLWVFLALFALLAVICFFFDDNGIGPVLGVVCVIIAIIILFVIFNYNADVKSAYVIEKKIELYQEKNEQIKADISVIVSNPELEANELVKRQISIYISNQEKIMSLSEELLDIEKKKVWIELY